MKCRYVHYVNRDSHLRVHVAEGKITVIRGGKKNPFSVFLQTQKLEEDLDMDCEKYLLAQTTLTRRN